MKSHTPNNVIEDLKMFIYVKLKDLKKFIEKQMSHDKIRKVKYDQQTNDPSTEWQNEYKIKINREYLSKIDENFSEEFEVNESMENYKLAIEDQNDDDENDIYSYNIKDMQRTNNQNGKEKKASNHKKKESHKKKNSNNDHSIKQDVKSEVKLTNLWKPTTSRPFAKSLYKKSTIDKFQHNKYINYKTKTLSNDNLENDRSLDDITLNVKNSKKNINKESKKLTYDKNINLILKNIFGNAIKGKEKETIKNDGTSKNFLKSILFDKFKKDNNNNMDNKAIMKNLLMKNLNKNLNVKLDSDSESSISESESIKSIISIDDKSIKALKKQSSYLTKQRNDSSGMLKSTIKQKLAQSTNVKQNEFQLSDFDWKHFKLDRYSDIALLLYKNKNSKNIIHEDITYSIPENSVFCIVWNLIITCILLFQMCSFPYEHFSEKWLSTQNNYLLINSIFEQFFIADLILNFFISVSNKYGIVERRSQFIAMNQLTSWFMIDLISSIPSTNFEQQRLFENSNTDYNNYFKILKLPKYIRVFKGILSMFQSKFADIIDSELFGNMSTIEKTRQYNLLKYLIQIIFISNILSCYLISLTNKCIDAESCQSWFFSFMTTEQHQFIHNTQQRQSALANSFQEQQGAQGVMHQQNQILDNQRFQLYFDSWQQVLQTVTTVGQGDVDSFSSEERIFRSACMIIGSVLFSLLSSLLLEFCISETMNVYRYNEHEVMIEKMQMKYDIKGDSKRFLSLLGDSVYTESLENELEFAKLLPKDMCQSVLKQIWNVQENKLTLLKEESMTFFMMMMKVSMFRRCVQEEEVGNDGTKIGLVYSGSVGLLIPNLYDYLGQENLYYLGIGSEMGQNHQINFQMGFKTNQVQRCIINCEIVEITSVEFVKLMGSSMKGLEQIQENLLEQLIELQLIVTLQYSMMKAGLQVGLNWYNYVTALLQFNTTDFDTLNKIQENMKGKKKSLDRKTTKKQQDKWFINILDSETQKYILMKCKHLIKFLVGDEQVLLKEYIRNQKRRRQSNSNSASPTKYDLKLSRRISDVFNL